MANNDPRASAAAAAAAAATGFPGAAGFAYENVDDVDLSGFDFSGILDAGAAGAGGAGPGLFGNRATNLVNLLATPDTCLYRNILDIWQSNFEAAINNQSQPLDIVRDVNAALEKRSVHYQFVSFRPFFLLLLLLVAAAVVPVLHFPPKANSNGNSNRDNHDNQKKNNEK